MIVWPARIGVSAYGDLHLGVYEHAAPTSRKHEQARAAQEWFVYRPYRERGRTKDQTMQIRDLSIL